MRRGCGGDGGYMGEGGYEVCWVERIQSKYQCGMLFMELISLTSIRLVFSNFVNQPEHAVDLLCPSL